jgi:hypothetical protein
MASMLVGGCVSLATGCSFVPEKRLADCRVRNQNLQSENARLKDLVLDLRTQNEDLNQRAEDDARRLALQDEAIDHLEKSVTAYQADINKMGVAYHRLESEVRTAVAPSSERTVAEDSSRSGRAGSGRSAPARRASTSVPKPSERDEWQSGTPASQASERSP